MNESLQYFNTAVLSGVAGSGGTETGRAVVMRFVDLKKGSRKGQTIRYTLECTFHVCQTAVTEQRSTLANDVCLTGKEVSRPYETQVSLPLSQNFPTRPYPEKAKSTLHIYTS